jgi:hypothetical protein
MTLKELLHEREALEKERQEICASIQPAITSIDNSISNINDRIEALITDPVKLRRDAEKKPYGMINVEFQSVRIKHDQPKKVKWDEKKLAAIVEKIKASNADPAEYVKINYKVEERKYTNWPSEIRKIFEPARTTETGTPKVTFEILEMEDEQPLPANVFPLKAKEA